MKKFFLIVIPFAFLATATVLSQPTQVKAATSQEIVNLLIRLGIISSDKAEQANKAVAELDTPTYGKACYMFTRNFGVGSTGVDVTNLTNVLVLEGLLNDSRSSYDEAVASAVSAYQEKYSYEILAPNGLNRGTGFVGASTRVRLNRGCTTGSAQISPIVSPSITPNYSPIVSPSNNLVITSVGSPANPAYSFYPGDRVTIVGSGFNNTSYVAWNGTYGTSILPISVTANNLVFIAPNVSAGNYSLQIMEKAGSVVSNTVNVTVMSKHVADPVISSVGSPGNPNFQFYPGDRVTIVGSNFPTNSSVYIGSTAVSAQVNTNGSNITFTAPQISSGNYPLSVVGKATQSNSVSITVLAKNQTQTPVVSYVQAPAENMNILRMNQRATVYGSNFSGSPFVKLVGKAQDYRVAAYNVYSGNLSFVVPTTLSTGDFDLYVEQSGVTSSPIRVQVVN